MLAEGGAFCISLKRPSARSHSPPCKYECDSIRLQQDEVNGSWFKQQSTYVYLCLSIGKEKKRKEKLLRERASSSDRHHRWHHRHHISAYLHGGIKTCWLTKDWRSGRFQPLRNVPRLLPQWGILDVDPQPSEYTTNATPTRPCHVMSCHGMSTTLLKTRQATKCLLSL